MPYLKYLEFVDFDSYYKDTINKIKNKRILLYGEGLLFKYMLSSDIFNELNIIGVSDRKYKNDISGKINNYKKIPINMINEYRPECILVTAKEYEEIVDFLEKQFPNILVLPLVKRTETQKKLVSEFKRYMNSIYLVNSKGRTRVDKVDGFDINFFGSFNVCEIHCENEDLNGFKNCKIDFIQDNGMAIIKSTCYGISNLNIDILENSSVVLNENIFSVGFNIYCKENSNCTIGSNCFIGKNTIFRTGDGHKIFDEEKKLINPPEDINIGNYVWFGMECMVLQKTIIPDNCIVGTRSLLNKKYNETNTLLAGSPAIVKKRNVSWEP